MNVEPELLSFRATSYSAHLQADDFIDEKHLEKVLQNDD